MKALSFILALTAMGASMAADVAWVAPTGGTVNASAGSTYGSLTLNYDMTTGNPSSFNAYSTTLNSVVNIRGGDFYAGDYTVSLWLTTAQLTSDKVLFSYSGSTSGQVQGYNGITWNSTNKTITIGQGNYTSADHSFAFYDSNYKTTNAITLNPSDDLINLTFSVKGESGSQTATLWVNGMEFQTLESYNGNMNNPGDTMLLHFDTNTTYGRIAITNEALTTVAQIAALANVPEPATATLSLLALVGVAARRRRKAI
ncbi:MAG: PEP-CTERM sorting domain-containing protein [Akkermansia sp.]